MIKVIDPSWNFGEALTSIVERHSRGVDVTWLQKRAACFSRTDLDDVPALPDHTYLHILALGDSDFHGPNANGDAYTEKGGTFKAAENGKPIVLDVGNVQTHHTFQKMARVYRDHKNTDPTLSFGPVIKSAHNDRMKRVELIIAVPNDKFASDLNDLDRGEQLGWSMSCRVSRDTCLPPGSQILVADGLVAVEDVEAGDFVLTHKGRLREVKEVFTKEFSGTMVSLAVRGLGRPITCTGNHPVLIAKREIARSCAGHINGKRRRHSFRPDGTCKGKNCKIKPSDIEMVWVPAEEVRLDDYVFVPRSNAAEDENNAIDIPLARMCGYFLGDGSFQTRREGRDRSGGRRLIGITITSHEDDKEHIARVADTFSELSEKPVHVMACGSGKRAVVISCADPVLTAQVYHLCGEKKDKHLPAALFVSSRAAQLACLGGLIDTDGCVSKTNRGDVRFVNTSKTLSVQTHFLAVQLGIPASRNSYQATSGFCRKDGSRPIVHQLCFGHGGAEALREHSWKCARRDRAHSDWYHFPMLLPEGVLYPVKGVNSFFVKEQPVHNFSVDEDESYLVEGVAVHNCSACGNEAKTRADYCDHAKNHLTKITKSGHQVFVYNDHMQYFDISRVRRPADRIALTFQKLAASEPAAEAVGGAELASRMGLTTPAWMLPHLGHKYAHLLNLAKKLAVIEKEVPAAMQPDQLAAVGRTSLPPSCMESLQKEPIEPAMSAMCSRKICLSLPDFIALMTRRPVPDGATNEIAGLLPGVFGRLLDEDAIGDACCSADMCGCGTGMLSRSLTRVMPEIAERLSLDDVPVRKRIMIISVKGFPARQLKAASSRSNSHPLAKKLAFSYAGYQLGLLNQHRDDDLLPRLLVFGNYFGR